MRTRVKICGLTRAEDVQAAVDAGADALGLVFYPKSPRAICPQTAGRLIQNLPPFVTVTGLFVNAAPSHIESVLSQVHLDLLQFHGDEAAADCRRYAKPWIKAVRMRPDVDLHALVDTYHEGNGLLLDTYHPALPGGTGERFDWERIPADLAPRVILAGGLTSDNVAQAIRRVRPYAVDVSGGVEQSKGIKDADKIKQFIREVRRGEFND